MPNLLGFVWKLHICTLVWSLWLKQTDKNKRASPKHGLNLHSWKKKKNYMEWIWGGECMLSSSLRIFSQHLIFYPKQWLLNGTCQFLLCKSPGTLPACNMSSVPSLKMCRDFDNHVKQTLSHSCVIRNSLSKMPWWCWGLHALRSIPPATIRVNTVPTAPSQLHSAISQLCPWCWESLTPWDLGMLSVKLLGCTALG